MRKILACALAGGALMSFHSLATAVPVVFAGPFENRGQCEAAAAEEVNRIRGLDRFGPGDRDDVNRRAHAALSCEEEDDGWYLIREV
jgi:hypothetical protein